MLYPFSNSKCHLEGLAAMSPLYRFCTVCPLIFSYFKMAYTYLWTTDLSRFTSYVQFYSVPYPVFIVPSFLFSTVSYSALCNRCIISFLFIDIPFLPPVHILIKVLNIHRHSMMYIFTTALLYVFSVTSQSTFFVVGRELIGGVNYFTVVLMLLTQVVIHL